MDNQPCPKCGYVRQAGDTAPAIECPRCGIVYAKYLQYLLDRKTEAAPSAHRTRRAKTSAGWQHAKAALLHRPAAARHLLWPYASLFVVFAIWGLRLISYDPIDGEVGDSFMHLVNTPFHEFGHILFRPFGRWLTILGGSLFQCLWPIFLCGVFLLRERQPFAASMCLWWTGENLLDVAPYIGDARAMALPLIGELSDTDAETRYLRHDWHNLLEPLGMLEWDHRLAYMARALGAAVIVLAWTWGAAWLWRVYRDGPDTAE